MGTEIGVVIAQYGQSALTEKCVAGLVEHHEGQFPIVVIDDGSRNRSEIRWLQDCSVATLIALPRNRGVTHAWNTGARHLIQTYAVQRLVYLNNDVTTHGVWLPLICESLSGSAFILGHGWREERWMPDELVPLVPDRRLLQGYCLAVASETFVELGGFDPRLRLYFSDTDLQLRALLKYGDTALQAIPQLPIKHVGHQTVANLSNRYGQWEADRQRFIAKWKHGMTVNRGSDASGSGL